MTYKYTDDWLTAYNNAKYDVVIYLVGTTTTAGNIASSFHIPKGSLNTTPTLFVDGYYYNSSSYALFQIKLSSTSCSDIGVHHVGKSVTTNVYYYYR